MSIYSEIVRAWLPLAVALFLFVLIVSITIHYLKAKQILELVKLSSSQRRMNALLAVSLPLVLAISSQEIVIWVLMILGAVVVWSKKYGLRFKKNRF